MNRSIRFFMVGISAMALFLLGCEKTPDEEVSRARSALSTAKKVGADTSDPKGFLTATQLLDSAIQLIDGQKGSFSKDFSEAKKLLQEVEMRAQAAGIQSLKPAVASEVVKTSSAPATDSVLTAPKKDTVLLAKPEAKGGVDTVKASTPSHSVSKNFAESRVNLVYALYTENKRKAKSDPLMKPHLDSAMTYLKAAQSFMKDADYASAVGSAQKAENLLTGN